MSKLINGIIPATATIFLLLQGSALYSEDAQSYTDPNFHETFSQGIKGLSTFKTYLFGTGSERNLGDLEKLREYFSPWGLPGQQVINQEWERYQPFNDGNFVFTEDALNITATIPKGGGLWPGGIHSGQIWTQETFQPGRDGKQVYAFEVRMKIPPGPGMWPAAWFFTKIPGIGDLSEIDNPEFLNEKWQNEFDWTSNLRGPGSGPIEYSIRSNPWTYHPGLNFSADYHDYQTIWTEDKLYAYLDGTLISCQAFKWTSGGEAQLGVNLAVGSSAPNLPGLQPDSLSEFPAALSVQSIKIWAK